jgi:hypothetical protein
VHLQVRMTLKGVPVLLVVAIGVPHGMRIFTQDQWPRFILFVCPCFNLQELAPCHQSHRGSSSLNDFGKFVATHLGREIIWLVSLAWECVENMDQSSSHLVDAGIHRAQNIRCRSSRATSLIVHGPRGIPCPDVASHRKMCYSSITAHSHAHNR